MTVMKMTKKMSNKWPGWRNIKHDTGKTKSVNLDILSKNCVAWRYSPLQYTASSENSSSEETEDDDDFEEIKLERSSNRKGPSLQPTPDVSIEEPVFEEENIASMTLLESGDFRQQLRAQHHSSLADTDLDDFLNTAFTLEHPNLAIPRDGKIEANRVYDLTLQKLLI